MLVAGDENMISRRQLLIAAARNAPIASAGLALSPRRWPVLLPGEDDGFEPSQIAELVRAAPRARYWVSTAAGDCLACHTPKDDISDRRHHDADKHP